MGFLFFNFLQKFVIFFLLENTEGKEIKEEENI